MSVVVVKHYFEYMFMKHVQCNLVQSHGVNAFHYIILHTFCCISAKGTETIARVMVAFGIRVVQGCWMRLTHSFILTPRSVHIDSGAR